MPNNRVRGLITRYWLSAAIVGAIVLAIVIPGPASVLARLHVIDIGVMAIMFIGSLKLAPGRFKEAIFRPKLIGLSLISVFAVAPLLSLGIASVLGGLTVFFIGGGLTFVRFNADKVPWYAWLVPNTHAVDPLRDLVLFQSWPVDWTITLLKLTAFALASLVVGLGLAGRRLRRLG